MSKLDKVLRSVQREDLVLKLHGSKGDPGYSKLHPAPVGSKTVSPPNSPGRELLKKEKGALSRFSADGHFSVKSVRGAGASSRIGSSGASGWEVSFRAKSWEVVTSRLAPDKGTYFESLDDAREFIRAYNPKTYPKKWGDGEK